MRPLNTLASEHFAASFSRIWQRLNKEESALGIITAFRDEFEGTPKNKSRNQLLKADIKNAGFGYFNIKGFYIENYGQPNAKHVKEDAIFVLGRHNDNGLRPVLKKLGYKYEQDSILFKPFNRGRAYLIGTSPTNAWPGLGEIIDLGPWSTNKLCEFYTKMKGRNFVFASASYEPSNMTKAYMNKGLQSHTDPEPFPYPNPGEFPA
ncbi:hypothetical protein LZ24_03307 [Desulfobotulus alkaliphilus]|uniref:Uncharacterized protein n=1 Tax=Desulfobotulus alkaliphilus TaxID=622671 RepID=A0A562R2V6_9BACT|nr:hypothetical protein [Desulfobotulus alkaliphilus]TWI63143.1 hypothetical protein LZ24_03307 [Desulfobotulus alkaliphilus]